jgi:hypothetical protein
MNYQSKEILYKVKNMTKKYLDISCSDAMKPVQQTTTSCYKKKQLKHKKITQ